MCNSILKDVCVCVGGCLDVGLGKADAQMVRLGQLVVVHLDQSAHGLLDRAQLDQGHLVVFREKFESFDFETIFGEGFFNLFLGYCSWNVA